MAQELTQRQKEALEKVTKYIEENPGTTPNAALKTTGVSYSSYYVAKRKLAGVGGYPPKTKKKRSTNGYKMLAVEPLELKDVEPAPSKAEPAPAVADRRKMVMMVGDVEDMRAVLRGLL